MKNRNKFIALYLLLFIGFVISLAIGRYHIDIKTIFQIVKCKMLNIPLEPSLNSSTSVLLSVRLPRSLLSLIVGTSLALSGTVFQGVFKNPLVSPDILGISSGASFGAAIAIIFLGNSPFCIQLFTFIFGLLAVFLAYMLAKSSRNETITILVIAGIVISALFSSGVSFLKYIADPYEQLPTIVFWTMGGFNSATLENLIRTFLTMLPGLAIIFLLRWKINLLSLDDDDAVSLGVEIFTLRKILIFSATLIAAASISSCGIISWVGLIVPHMGRMLLGPDHKNLIPFCAGLGGIFMLFMDTIARSISAAEIPISIITSFVGAPFLAYLLIKKTNNWSE